MKAKTKDQEFMDFRDVPATEIGFRETLPEEPIPYLAMHDILCGFWRHFGCRPAAFVLPLGVIADNLQNQKLAQSLYAFMSVVQGAEDGTKVSIRIPPGHHEPGILRAASSICRQLCSAEFVVNIPHGGGTMEYCAHVWTASDCGDECPQSIIKVSPGQWFYSDQFRSECEESSVRCLNELVRYTTSGGPIP